MSPAVLRRACVVVVLLLGACAGDPETDDPITVIPIDGRPSAVAASGGRIYVADDAEHVIHVFEDGGNVLPSIDLDDPNPIALTALGGAAWVAHAGGVLRELTGERRIEVEDASFTSIALMHGTLYATDVERGLYIVDPDDPGSGRFVELPQGGVRVISAFDRLWVSGTEDAVTALSLDGEVEETHTVGAGPIGLAAHAGGVWVANSDDGTVQLVGTDRTVPAGRGPVALVSAGGRLYVVNQDDRTVSSIDTSEQGTAEAIDVGTSGRGIDASGEAVWVAGTNAEVVVRVHLR